MHSRFSPSRARELFWYFPWLLGAGGIWMLSSMPQPPVPEPLTFWHSDKLMHVAAYAMLASLALWGAGMRRRCLSLRARIEALCLTLGYGILDEVHQAFTPLRSPSLGDVVADAIGALLVVTLGASAFVVLRGARGRQVGQ